MKAIDSHLLHDRLRAIYFLRFAILATAYFRIIHLLTLTVYKLSMILSKMLMDSSQYAFYKYDS